MAKNKSTEALFALNQELGRRVSQAREGRPDGKTVETSVSRGKKHDLPKGITNQTTSQIVIA
jgi:hypothetical protein